MSVSEIGNSGAAQAAEPSAFESLLTEAQQNLLLGSIASAVLIPIAMTSHDAVQKALDEGKRDYADLQ